MHKLGKGTRGVGQKVICVEVSAIHSKIAKLAHWLHQADTSVNAFNKALLIHKMGGDGSPYERIVV